MTIKLNSLAVNLVAETKGAWVESFDLPGVSFKVSGLNLPAFVTARNLLFTRLQRMHKKPEEIPGDVMSSEIGALLAQHVLHDWKGLDVPYAADVAGKTLADPAYRILVAAVQNCAARVGEPELEYVADSEN